MKKGRLLAGFAAAALAAGMMSLSAFASEAPETHTPYKYTAITYKLEDKTTYDFTKALEVEEDANVPAVTFTFTVTQAEAKAGTETSLPIYTTTVRPTVSDAVFAAGDAEKSKTVNVSFTGVEFSEPGVYRYYITETATENSAFTNDATPVRTLDVYVQDDGTGKLGIAGITFRNGRCEDSPEKSENPTALEKSTGYTNTYNTHDLTIAKSVEGNQASKDKYFSFTVAISNAGSGTKLNVDTTNATTAEITADTNGATTVSGTNLSGESAIVCGADGTANVTVLLQHGESIKITGLPDGAEYTITENFEDYTVKSIVPTGDDTDGTATEDDDKLTGEFTDTIKGDTTVTYTNEKKGVVPTGVMVSVAGPAVAGAAVLGGIITLTVRKRKEDKE